MFDPATHSDNMSEVHHMVSTPQLQSITFSTNGHGVVVCRVHNEPVSAVEAARVAAGEVDPHAPGASETELVARFEWLPHQARVALDRLREEIEAAEAQGLS
jgi:hypothetical protein